MNMPSGDLAPLAGKIAQILGGTTKVENQVVVASVQRNLNVEIMGVFANMPMTHTTSINFQPVESTDEASNFLSLAEAVLLDEEIDGVVSALRNGGVKITALHNHWTGQNPDLWYLHWMGLMPPLNFAQVAAKGLGSGSAS